MPVFRMFALLPLLMMCLVLSGCQQYLSFESAESVKVLTEQIKNADSSKDLKAIAKQAKVSRDLIRADIKAIKALYAELDEKVKAKWGSRNSALPTKTQYVKYTNNYQARTLVDFEQGWVRVETLDASSPKAALIDAVTTTLLTTSDPSKTDIFSSSAPNTEGVPFLYPQVLDHDGTLVRYRWRAERYATYLVENQLKTLRENGKDVYSVQFNLVEQHQHLRQEKYSDFVIAAANKYNLDPALIYGIIQTESSFNPYAVSPANAYGLMQVVPATAGKDVYNLVKKRSDEPTKQTLFVPEQNIDIGSAYLHILKTRYLVKVTNKTSREYAMISAYNGGTGNVLKAFDSDRTKAMSEINQSSSSTVYQKLRYDHPLSESRKYLEKVTTAKKSYQ
ncbi:murein transglycosylase domain-containing protein [Marinomonas sp. C2222]|uniref:Murein transglycosylase domain-containing protein n=1 Tax=Marinomonas sargassi TaxID=2984494 RepID=A0ABT2YV06_9GAMM|nr:murein transglycosylase domain-containing protein [Marinomonas sargassi]MCV2403595.1 murein transglycosylase domain-containing protein [Marinomonas sargassi]